MPTDQAAGFLVSALAAGIGVGSVLAGKLSGDRIELGIVAVGSALMGIFAFATGMCTSVAWALVWLFGLGLAGGLFIVPLNAFLQDRADPVEKGRILTTNNFINMVGVILASGVLTVLHDMLHLSAAQMLLAVGAFTLVGTIVVVRLLPGVTLRLFLLSMMHLLFRIRYVGAENLPKKGGALLVSNHTSYADAVLVGGVTRTLHPLPDVAALFREQIFPSVLRDAAGHPALHHRIRETRYALCGPPKRRSPRATWSASFRKAQSREPAT